VKQISVSERLTASVRALGSVGHRWLEDLPGVVAGLEAEWSITAGAPLGGGHAAYVAEAVTLSGQPVVLKVGLPPGIEGFAPFEQELTTLRLAEGDPYVKLLRHDAARRSLLLERLGDPLANLGWSTMKQLTAAVSTVARGWRPVLNQPLPTGKGKARWLADFVSSAWKDLRQPCAEAAAARAVGYVAERVAGLEGDRGVLVHGDAHSLNLLKMPGSPDDSGSFRLVDPEGLVSEPAHDLGVILRAWNEELLRGDTAAMAFRRCQHVTQLTGVNPEAIWQWSYIERLSTGLFLFSLGHRQEARSYLAVADRLAEVVPPWA